jgi:putative CocE/NonD family hydrolase
MSLFNRLMLKRLGVTQTHSVSIRRDVKISMPDGAQLLTDIYLGNAAGAPVILLRSPYGRSATFTASNVHPFAAQGFNVVFQSCRGTFGSTEKFDPHHDEQRDGLATLEWIKQQPWCNGAIATFGMSYLGYTQWAIAAAAGPEVKAMAMQVTLSDFAQMTYAGNAFMLENALSWTRLVTLMKTPRALLWSFLLERLFKIPGIRREQWKLLPLADMDEKIIGQRVHFWRDWLQHASADDPWWAPMSHRRSIATIKRPITMVAGWFDIFLPWQMQDFQALQKNGCETRITVGPWSHTDMGLAHAAMHDALDWFKRYLLGDNDTPQQKAVKLYVIGADEWRCFDEWPPRETRCEHWYLQSQHQLFDRIAETDAADQYRYDPLDPTPAAGGPSLFGNNFSIDNAQLEARSDVLIYTSEPFVRHKDIIGPIHAELFVASTAESADFFVRLCDVDEQGISKNICDGLQRVAIQSSNSAQCVRIALWPTAYRIKRGHKLRAQISSGAFPRWARNLGGAEPLAQQTQPRAATQTIYHSADYPSAIVIPIVES